ncbi:MAG TPA: cytochrome c [Candidatus Eremiobacteraceae bacterium]|nr:cytochrome c [Candidatus Eremiobacteraceae bacterium]
MKKLLAVLTVVLASGAIVAACSGSSSSDNSSSSSSATAAATDMSAATAAPMTKSTLPIPLAKLKSMTVASGNVAAGKAVFDSNCMSCHGAGAKNQGGPGPTLAGTGIKAGQVAFMVRNPAAIDPESGMPKLPITDKQLADVSAYVASLK